MDSVNQAKACQVSESTGKIHLGGTPHLQQDSQSHAEEGQTIKEIDNNDIHLSRLVFILSSSSPLVNNKRDSVVNMLSRYKCLFLECTRVQPGYNQSQFIRQQDRVGMFPAFKLYNHQAAG